MIAILSIVSSWSALALEVASPFTEHMVLQREMAVPIWGWGEPGERVSISVAGKSARGNVKSDGRWKVTLPKLKAGGPHVLTVESGDDKIEISDVLVGEVWICSGQSNMQMGYNRLKNYEPMLEAARQLPIRSLPVERRVRFTPQERFAGEWRSEPCQSAVGFVFAYELQKALGVPVGIIEASWGSSSIEGWMPMSFQKRLPHFRREMEAFEKYDRVHLEQLLQKESNGEKRIREDDIYMRTRPNVLYNAMLYPIAPYAVRGLAWYQGEANSNALANMRQYSESLPLWRDHLCELWGREDFFVMGVMLPRYGRIASGSPVDSTTAPDAHSWAWFRESQTRLLDRPHTAIVNTIDLGDIKNIHPNDKEPIGERMALIVRSQIHGEKVVSSGPVFERLEKSRARTLRIQFANAEGLQTTDGGSPRAFWIAGSDRVWKPAKAEIVGTAVALRSDEVTDPEAVRYAFAGFPDVNLVNAAGLPAMPFRTDSDTPDGYNGEPELVTEKWRRR